MSELVSYIWNIALYGAETWAIRQLQGKYVESFEMWRWRRMKKIKWSGKVSTGEVLERIEEKRRLLNNILRRKPIGLVIF